MPIAYDVIIGIDPGAKGALVALSLATDHARVWRPRRIRLGAIPVVDLSGIAPGIRGRVLVILESVEPRRAWGSRGNFILGGYAAAVATAARAAGWTVEHVAPRRWQADLHVAGVHGKAKEKTAQTYAAMFPDDPLPRGRTGEHDHNVVDALMLALWGVKKVGAPWRRWQFPKRWRTA